MASLLYRLGRWCADHVKTVIAAWLIVLAALGGGAATFGTPPTPEVTIPGSTFQNVLDLHHATMEECLRYFPDGVASGTDSLTELRD